MTQIAATKTPATPQQIVDALAAIWPSELGGTGPSLEMACVLASQWAIETDDGRSMIQWNIGNFKYDGSGDYCMFSTNEWIGGVETTIHPPDPGCRFMAFASIEIGVRYWLRDLYTRWSLAWNAAVSGDPEGFAQGLHDRKPPYYTAPVAQYAAGMRRYFDPFLKTLTVPPPAVDPLADTSPPGFGD
jgi:hypothetical protein